MTQAAEYASAADALAAVEVLAARVVGHLDQLAAGAPSGGTAARFAASLRADLERHRREREELRRWRGLGRGDPRPPSSPPSGDVLDDLRDALEKLVYAHAEALPALGDPVAVRTLARQMVDVSRHHTLVGLWTSAEEERG